MLKLYGHYGSQPTRSIAWLLKMKHEPFDFISINPIKGDNRSKESKFPLGLIPAIEDDPGNGETLALSEASAIMIYLCETNKWDDIYPTNHCPSSIRRRALINEYISHHNESTRMMTRKVIRPGLTGVVAAAKNPGVSPSRTHSLSRSADDLMKLKSTIRDVSKRFQHKFLVNSRESSDFIVGDTVSIADLLAYPELAQIQQLLGIDYGEWSELEALRRWLDRMATLPFHDDVHRTVSKLGKLYQSKL